MLKVIKKITSSSKKNLNELQKEYISFQGFNVLLANHTSLEDYEILDKILPKNVVFAIHEDEKEVIKKIQNRKYILFHHLEPKSLISIERTIESKVPVLLFPELTFSKTGALTKFYDEIITILIRKNPTIYPIYLTNYDESISILSGSTPPRVGVPFTLPFTESKATDSLKEKISIFLLKHFQLGLYESLSKKNVNLFNEMIERAKKDSNKIIMEDQNNILDFKKFAISSYVLSNKLESLLKDSKIIGTMLPTSTTYVTLLFSLFKLGKTPAMLNFTMGEQTIKDNLETARISIILTSKQFIEKANLEELIESLKEIVTIIYLEDVEKTITTTDKILAIKDFTVGKKSESKNNELLLFTSGSESKPKGVILTHDNIYANIYQCIVSIDLNKEDRLMNVLPMFHSFGLTVGAILPIITGNYVYLYPTPTHYKIIPDLIYQKKATFLFATSTFFSMYGKNAHNYDFHSVRYAIAGAEKLKDEVYHYWNEHFNVRILEGYGVTESSPVLSLNTPILYQKGSVGTFLPGVEYKIEPVEGISDGGNLFVKGPNVMKGYLLHEKGFVPLDEWHDTGDVVTVDENGFVTIVSRLKRFAKIGGEMVSLNLVEELARKCFKDEYFAAVSVPDRRKGEKIILYTPNTEVTLRDFKKYIKTNKLSMLPLPKDIRIIDQIPILGNGKTDYVTLQQWANEEK